MDSFPSRRTGFHGCRLRLRRRRYGRTLPRCEAGTTVSTIRGLHCMVSYPCQRCISLLEAPLARSLRIPPLAGRTYSWLEPGDVVAVGHMNHENAPSLLTQHDAVWMPANPCVIADLVIDEVLHGYHAPIPRLPKPDDTSMVRPAVAAPNATRQRYIRVWLRGRPAWGHQGRLPATPSGPAAAHGGYYTTWATPGPLPCARGDRRPLV